MINENLGEITTWDDEWHDDEDLAPLGIDDSCWDAFLPDDDQCDPLPDLGDFWIDDDLLEAGRPAA